MRVISCAVSRQIINTKYFNSTPPEETGSALERIHKVPKLAQTSTKDGLKRVNYGNCHLVFFNFVCKNIIVGTFYPGLLYQMKPILASSMSLPYTRLK